MGGGRPCLAWKKKKREPNGTYPVVTNFLSKINGEGKNGTLGSGATGKIVWM